MTLFFQNHEITILRLRQRNGITRTMSATGTVHPADIQPITDERLNLFGGRIGKMYQAFVNPDCTVEEGDVVRVVGSGKTYAVNAVSTYAGAGLLDHKELILISQD